LSGFFGIGGGFLIVPALILANTGMPILYAVGSSLVAVTAFGLTTAANYAMSSLVDWSLAALFVSGGVLGGLLGARSANSLASRIGALNTVFAALIFAVAILHAGPQSRPDVIETTKVGFKVGLGRNPIGRLVRYSPISATSRAPTCRAANGQM
jgi:uncharacterized membrane protein YfcA